MPVIIAGFPGTGKTWATKAIESMNDSKDMLYYKVADLNSNDFVYLDKNHTIKNKDYRKSYIDRVKYLIDHDYSIIFVDANINMMDYLDNLALQRNDISLALILPDVNSITMYKDIYRKNKYPDRIYHMIIDNWSQNIDVLSGYAKHTKFKVISLKENMHILDITTLSIKPRISNDGLIISNYVNFDV